MQLLERGRRERPGARRRSRRRRRRCRPACTLTPLDVAEGLARRSRRSAPTHDQRGRRSPKPAERLGGGLGRRRRRTSAGSQTRQRAALGVDRQRGAQRLLARLAVDLDGVAARLRAERDAAAVAVAAWTARRRGRGRCPSGGRPSRRSSRPRRGSSVDAVPARRAFSSARAVSWTRPMLNSSPKTSSSRSTLPVLPMREPAVLAMSGTRVLISTTPPLGPGTAPRMSSRFWSATHVDDLEPALGDALVAHLARAANALEHARRRGRRADRARRAHVVRAVGDRAAAEVVALDRALEALALRGAGDLDLLALLEDVDGQLLADLEALALVAELARWRSGASPDFFRWPSSAL